ncbi:MAG: hypothetical protein PHW04_08185 [Candidatus Wallbacteria bacterium]|nr:hypothetical protein [Candidatus Wallbacteria bacterium]
MFDQKPDALKLINTAKKSLESPIRYQEAEIELTKSGLLLKGSDPSGALQHAHKAIGLNPKNVSAYLMAVKCFDEEKKIGDAIALLEFARTINPTYKIYEELSRLYQEISEPVKALTLWQAYLEHFPNQSKGYLQIAELYWSAQSYEAALSHFSRAGEIESDSLKIQLSIAGCLEQLRRFDEAGKIYQKCLEWELSLKDRLLIIKNLAHLCEERKFFLKATEYMEQYLSLDPNPRDYEYQGDLFLRAGKRKDAITAFQKSFKTDNLNFKLALKISGVYYLLLSQSRDSAHWLQKALEINPEAKDIFTFLEKMSRGENVAVDFRQYWNLHLDLELTDSENLADSEPDYLTETAKAVTDSHYNLENFLFQRFADFQKSLTSFLAEESRFLKECEQSLGFVREMVNMKMNAIRTAPERLEPELILRDLPGTIKSISSGYKKPSTAIRKGIARIGERFSDLDKLGAEITLVLDEISSEFQIFHHKLRNLDRLPVEVRKKEMHDLSLDFQKKISGLLLKLDQKKITGTED